MSEFSPSALIDHYFIKLIQMANKNGIKVYWYTMPFNNTSCDAVSSEIIRDFDSYIDDVSNKEGTEIIKKIHCLDSQYFGGRVMYIAVLVLPLGKFLGH